MNQQYHFRVLLSSLPHGISHLPHELVVAFILVKVCIVTFCHMDRFSYNFLKVPH